MIFLERDKMPKRERGGRERVVCAIVNMPNIYVTQVVERFVSSYILEVCFCHENSTKF